MEIGNIGTGNNSTLATFNKCFAGLSSRKEVREVFLLSLLGDLEFRSLGEVGDFLLRNRDRFLAQQRAAWLRKALGGAS